MPERLALLACLALPACGLASAEPPLPTVGLFDTGGTEESGPERGAWPVAAVLDPGARQLRLQWGQGQADNELISFDEVVRLERTRPYEGLPDELVVLLADGRRVLLSHGPDVATHVALAPAMTGLPFKELGAGEGHVTDPVSKAKAAPRFAIGSGAGVALRAGESGSAQLGSLELGAEDKEERSLLTAEAAATLKRHGGGELKREEIELGIKQGLGGIRDCYEKQLQRDPSLLGKVTVSFVIGVDGTVAFAALKSSSLDQELAEACVLEQVKGLRFQPPRGGKTVVVSYPFRFAPS